MLQNTPTGFVVYQGPSLLDGAPIVAIATVSSRNVKTGPMVSLWIMRSDVDPVAALHTGDDVSICGLCPHRPSPRVAKAVVVVPPTRTMSPDGVDAMPRPSSSPVPPMAVANVTAE